MIFPFFGKGVLVRRKLRPFGRFAVCADFRDRTNANPSIREAGRGPRRAEQEIVLHLFDVVRRIESNLKIHLQQNTLCGFNLIRRKEQARRVKRQ
jgi:hypothetical protein